MYVWEHTNVYRVAVQYEQRSMSRIGPHTLPSSTLLYTLMYKGSPEHSSYTLYYVYIYSFEGLHDDNFIINQVVFICCNYELLIKAQ